MNRDEAMWYYRLGGQTLGPVAWTEIEQLTRDTVDAEDLLVARGGDETWMSAADATDRFPELAEEVPQAEEPAPDFEMPPRQPGEDAQASASEATGPSAAASAVLSEAETARDTGRPSATAVGGGFAPEHGIGSWLNQAWRMVIDEIWAWVGAMLLVMIIGGLTLGIAWPPLVTGLYMMALKRFRGEAVGAGDVFAGFRRFLPSWGLTLLMSIPALLIMAPIMILFAIPAIQAQGAANMEDLAVGMGVGMQLLMPVLWLLALAVQTIFFYSWVLVADGHGAWESVTGSWAKVSASFWSYLGMWILLTIIASIGSYLCYVGMLVTYPLQPCAQVAAYMWHYRRT